VGIGVVDTVIFGGDLGGDADGDADGDGDGREKGGSCFCLGAALAGVKIGFMGLIGAPGGGGATFFGDVRLIGLVSAPGAVIVGARVGDGKPCSSGKTTARAIVSLSR
jgi:hypothetical protein